MEVKTRRASLRRQSLNQPYKSHGQPGVAAARKEVHSGAKGHKKPSRAPGKRYAREGLCYRREFATIETWPNPCFKGDDPGKESRIDPSERSDASCGSKGVKQSGEGRRGRCDVHDDARHDLFVESVCAASARVLWMVEYDGHVGFCARHFFAGHGRRGWRTFAG